MTIVAADPWSQLESWIRGGCREPAPGRQLFESRTTTPMRRLRDALVSRDREGAPGPMDIAVLVRHALWSVRTGDVPPTMWLPRGADWPGEEHWAEAGLLVAADGDGQRVILGRWSPPWLPLSSEVEPGEAAAHAVWRRPDTDDFPVDPFFRRALGLETYSSAGQREAVRAVALAPDGGTVIVNLPTGSGKSAVAYSVAAFRAKTSPAVAIIVVPTTALALDQDRAFRESARQAGLSCPDVLAYHGGLAPQARDALRQRIRTGLQTIVFTSPESLLGGLRAAVFEAASRGLISLFAVDEAHVAVAWGEEFRPDFQFMGPLRDQLLAHQRATNGERGFPTVLMSGTLTAGAIDRLIRDFGRNSAVEVVSAAALRPEPEYWIAEDAGEAERERRVLDALAHLPRPAILYTTRPSHADRWRDRLQRRGYRRIAVVHGGTNEGARQAAMAGVRGRGLDVGEPRSTIDLIIGTSAYGLGVDQPDVRTIVHACVPESLDRFYQEVGRGGRDGGASASVLIPAFEDWPTARSLAFDAIITVEKARERWKAMKTGSEAVPGGGRRVRLGEVPAYLFRESDTNAAWNLRTLLLLQQAGILRIRIEEPPKRAPGETDPDWDERAAVEWRRQRTTRILDVFIPESDTGRFWQEVEVARAAAFSRGRSGYNAMAAGLRERDDLAHAFAAEYGVGAGQVPSSPDLEIHVARACGGCPGCRRAHRRPSAGYVPIPPPAAVAESVDARITGLFHGGANDVVLVLVDDWREPRTGRRLRKAINELVSKGVRSVVATPQIVEALRDTLASRPVAVSTAWQPTALPNITTAVIAVDSAQTAIPVHEVLHLGPPRLVFVDPDTPDPDWPNQRLGARSHVITLDLLLHEL